MHYLRQPIHQLRPQVFADGFFHRGTGILTVFFLFRSKPYPPLLHHSASQITGQNNHRFPEITLPPLRIR